MVLLTIMAAVVAPIVIEILFRLVLQGGLEAAEARAWISAVAAESAATETFDAAAPNVEEHADSLNPYVAPAAIDDSNAAARELQADVGDYPADALRGPVIRELPKVRVWNLPAGTWPIVISFDGVCAVALAARPGPDSLFILAAVLGFLYRQTHRLLPSIVVHMLLNSCSLLIYWLQPSQ